ncbi:anthranilate synthase component I family protein [Nocardioides sp.]|uniref:anthranilate synthase component I family protein n=1 Tax=Nocardioides sp. TaxID=35761 RepID=UPI003519D718
MSDVEQLFADVAARHRRCFWLDGGGAREWSGRRSLLGWLDDDGVSLSYDAAAGVVTRHRGGRSVTVGEDPFAVLAAELAAGDPRAAWFGYFGYAARPDLPARPDPAMPDAVWMRADHVRVFDHPLAGPATPLRTAPAAVAVPASYAAGFAAVQEHLHAGDTYEVNLTYRQHHAGPAGPDGPARVYRRLRTLNPAPYAGFLQHDVPGARGWLLSSSPERYAVVGADRVLQAKPIKGTLPRDPDAAVDAAHAAELARDPRFRAENLMIVDLLRHDLAQVCEVGSVEVPDLMVVESYPGVHQLVSTVRGRLRDGVGTVAALRALFPAGSMTGAPKRRTMQVIDAVEPDPRGVYSGAFGWVSADGRADLGVVIRSLATAGDGDYLLGTGGGITVHSELATEWTESTWKAARVASALTD